MNLIVAVDNNYAIGNKNDLLYFIPEDLGYFKHKTSGKTVVMGEKTLFSLPNGKPLPNRRNIVMSLSPIEENGFEVVGSVSALLEKIKDIPEDDVWVMGGQMIYELLFPHCKKLYITHIYAEKEYDKHLQSFRDAIALGQWRIEEDGEWQVSVSGVRFKYVVYGRG